jgi:hypothetical protein
MLKRIQVLAVVVFLAAAAGCGRHRCCQDNVSYAPPPPPLPCDPCR